MEITENYQVVTLFMFYKTINLQLFLHKYPTFSQVAYKGNLGKDFYGEYLSILDSSIGLEIKEGSQYTRYGFLSVSKICFKSVNLADF